MSLFRSCSLGYPLHWYAGNRFNPISVQKADPLAAYTIVCGGVVVLETSDIQLAEDTFNDLDAQLHQDYNPAKGPLELGSEKLDNAIATSLFMGEE